MRRNTENEDNQTEKYIRTEKNMWGKYEHEDGP